MPSLSKGFHLDAQTIQAQSYWPKGKEGVHKGVAAAQSQIIIAKELFSHDLPISPLFDADIPAKIERS